MYIPIVTLIVGSFIALSIAYAIGHGHGYAASEEDRRQREIDQAEGAAE